MKKVIFDYSIVVIGNLILALAVNMFILPFNILSGGVAGIAIALEPITHLNPNTMINILVLGLFIIGALALGKEFALKTAVSSIVYPLFLTLTSPYLPVLHLDPFLASLYGGAVAGVGIGMVLRTGSSTGGMDIPPLILKKYFNFDLAKSVLVIDGLTVLLGLFTYGLEAVLVGLISVFTTSFAINKVLTFGAQNCKSVQIISDYYEDIMNKVHNEMGRGSTLIEATGGYTQDNKKVLLVVVENNEYRRLLDIVNDIDKSAFVITTDTMNVHGEGFNVEFRV